MICFATFLFELCDDRLCAEEVLSSSAGNPVSVKIEPGLVNFYLLFRVRF